MNNEWFYAFWFQIQIRSVFQGQFYLLTAIAEL